MLPGGPPPTALMIPRGFTLGASGAIVLANGVVAGLALRND